MANGSAVHELAPGVELKGRYKVLGPISSGAMGAVYRAADEAEGGEVAIKRLMDVRHAARFEIEARLLAQLRHPRIVRVIDYFLDDTGQYLVMELVEGTDLGGMLKQHGRPGLPVENAIDYVRQTAEALQ